MNFNSDSYNRYFSYYAGIKGIFLILIEVYNVLAKDKAYNVIASSVGLLRPSRFIWKNAVAIGR
jgi:hypothetical protein